MNEKQVRSIIAEYNHEHQSEEAPLELKHVELLIEEMRRRLANEFGVTVTQDHNGAWGPLGQRLVTLRFYDDEDFVDISMAVVSVRSQRESRAHNAYLRENK